MAVETLLRNAGLIACPREQVVGSQPILPDAGLRIECEMRGGIRRWLEPMCQRQGLRIDERSGGLYEGESIFKEIPLFKSDAPLRERSHPSEIVVLLAERVVHEMQERGGAWHEILADPKTMG